MRRALLGPTQSGATGVSWHRKDNPGRKIGAGLGPLAPCTQAGLMISYM